MAQSNQLVNEKDQPAQTRSLLIQFEPLRRGDIDSGEVLQEFGDLQQLVSCLCVDLVTILYEGKLDSQAIGDCARFLELVLGISRDRNAGCWALELYFMLQLNSMYGSEDGQERAHHAAEIVDFIVRSAWRMQQELVSHQSPLEKMVLLLRECLLRRENSAGHERETLGLHNYLLLATPNAPPFNDSGRWVAIQLESVLSVITAITGKHLSASEVRRCAQREEVSWAQMGRARFYDTRRCGWPITYQELDEFTHVSKEVPIPESDLTENTTTLKDALFLSREKVDEIEHASRYGSRAPPAYGSIRISSAFPGAGNYLFFDAVTQVEDTGEFSWFG